MPFAEKELLCYDKNEIFGLISGRTTGAKGLPLYLCKGSSQRSAVNNRQEENGRPLFPWAGYFEITVGVFLSHNVE